MGYDKVCFMQVCFLLQEIPAQIISETYLLIITSFTTG